MYAVTGHVDFSFSGNLHSRFPFLFVPCQTQNSQIDIYSFDNEYELQSNVWGPNIIGVHNHLKDMSLLSLCTHY